MLLTESRRRGFTLLFISVLILVYLSGIVLMRTTVGSPSFSYLANIAYPIDCMVILPALFYALVIRRHGLSPVFVLPLLWLGGFLASSFSQGSVIPLVAVLGIAALMVEVVIVVHEIRRFVTVYMHAKGDSSDPFVWFSTPLQCLMRNKRASIMVAREFTAMYYAFFTWRKKSSAPRNFNDSEVFTYHKNGTYMATIMGLMLVIPVEIIVLHMWVATMNDIAAWMLTALSVYTVIWLIADCRATFLRPIELTDEHLVIRSGIRFSTEIPLKAIEGFQKNAPEYEKRDLLNLGSMGNTNCWILLEEPFEVETFTGGSKTLRAIGLEIDDYTRFSKSLHDKLERSTVC